MVCVMSGFRREVDEKCVLLGHYVASTGNVRVMVKNYHCSLRNGPEESSSEARGLIYRLIISKLTL
jgi:hypothetical protein